jgi:YtkA-like
MKTILSKISILFFVIISLLSCKDEVKVTAVHPLEGLIKLKEGYAAGAKVEVWGKKNFFQGYNNLTVVLLDSTNTKDTIKDAHIHFLPFMTMPMMQHACPVENPDETAINGVFPGAISFVMASMGGTWDLGMEIHNHKIDKEATVMFSNITVDSPTNTILRVFNTPANGVLVLSLLQPLTPKVGVNDIEFTINRKLSALEWPADSTFTLSINPTMPSMGHGSPNNVNPIHYKNGHYKGKVNFTMTGQWKIDVVLNNDTTIGKSTDRYFNITL